MELVLTRKKEKVPSMRNHPLSHCLFIFIGLFFLVSIGACQKKNGPNAYTLETPQVPFTSTRSLPATQSLPTPARSSPHVIVFINGSRIYRFDIEHLQLSDLYQIPKELGCEYYDCAEEILAGEGNYKVAHKLTNSPAAVSLSPNGKFLAILQSGYGRAPSNLHLLDLATRKLSSLLLAEKFEWRVPVIRGRNPDILFYHRSIGVEGSNVVVGAGSITNNIAYPFLIWDRSSQGVLFTTKSIFNGDLPVIAQAYYVPTNDAQAYPLGINSSEKDLGRHPQWAFDGHTIAFIQERLMSNNENKVFLVISDSSTQLVTQEIELPFTQLSTSMFALPTYLWAHSNTHIFFPNWKELSQKQTSAELYKVNILTKEVSPIAKGETGPISEPIIDRRLIGEYADKLFYLETQFVKNKETRHLIKTYEIIKDQTIVLFDQKLSEIDITKFFYYPEFQRAHLAPSGDKILVFYDQPCARYYEHITNDTPFRFRILSTKDGSLLFDSSISQSNQCLSLPSWSPDGRLVFGYSDINRMAIWDLDQKTYIEIAPHLAGAKSFLGWVP